MCISIYIKLNSFKFYMNRVYIFIYVYVYMLYMHVIHIQIIHTYMLLLLYHSKCTHVHECTYLNTQGVGSVPGHPLLTWGLHWEDTRVWPR